MLFTAMPMAHNQIVQPVRAAVERRTLREELEARGVRVIPSEKVRAYQRKMVQEERAKAGAWGKFWIFAYAYETFPLFFTMFHFSYAISLMLMLSVWPVSVVMLGGAVTIVAMQTPYLYLLCVHREKSILASAHWRRVLVDIPDRYSEIYLPEYYAKNIFWHSQMYVPVHAKNIFWHSQMYVPVHAKNIFWNSKQIPEVRVFVETLKDDPFMIARRSHGFWRRGEECVIAYWNAPGFDPD